MAPGPRRGIVKSGNAGNSSKSGNKIDATTGSPNDSDKPLFPPGSKYPASLLHERCQKNGWEKPQIDTRKHQDGWAFAIILTRIDRKTSQKTSVRLEPHPPYLCPSALEARHWGATYAMYRVRAIQHAAWFPLNRVLPRGPAEYWNKLAAEHKEAPDHLKWMYDADPFAARKEVEERQARAAEKQAQAAENSDLPGGSRHSSGSASREFSQAPEVRMAGILRDQVEDAVKQGLSLLPDTITETSSMSVGESQNIVQQLSQLGFKASEARTAVEFISRPSPVAANLLTSLSPLEACIEYLILHLPEEALPQRFLPSNNSSNPFVTSVHSGVDDLKQRWITDKAVKVAGWPPHIVKQLSGDSRISDNWVLLLAALCKKLVGEDLEELFTTAEKAVNWTIDTEEAEALGARFEEPGHFTMPLFSAPITLHIMVSSNGSYPRPGYAPMYITSTSIPAYIRLHLLLHLLIAISQPDFVEEGEGFCMAAMRCLEGAWASIEDNGPPDISTVFKHIMPSRPASAVLTEPTTTSAPLNSSVQRKSGPQRRDRRSDAEVREDFQKLHEGDKFAEIISSRKRLPAYSVKTHFLDVLNSHQVVVVVGETGCGKTTQLPQFILDSLILSNRGSSASILITQPRRLSAIGVATRVSSERMEDGSVGYAIRGESKQNDKTKLLFCTTGVVLRRLSLGNKLQDVTHIIVDEVHERSVDGDFLLLELRELLKTHVKLKVVLMSATINHETFAAYFNDAPVLTIPGYTHPVTDKYLEDIIPKINYRPTGSRSQRAEKTSKALDYLISQGLDPQDIAAIEKVVRSDRIDYELIASLVGHIIGTSPEPGGILIFLPGVQEIRQCMDALLSRVSKSNAEILPLHANLSSSEQMKVFAKTSKWKVIAATNVAETSITIDDVIYVIDAGKVKEIQYDSEANFSRLVETWVTRAAAKQRRGRAGRTQPGVCYKLYTRKQEENMIQYPVPEILRVPLESISLSVKVMREEEDVKSYLNRAIDPPKVVAIDRAWSILEELGAVDENGKLTALGRHISMLPIDLRLAKMLVLGTIFRCLDPILTIAACLSSKPLFLNPMDKREEANRARARFTKGNSDLLTDLNAYDQVLRLSSEGKSQSSTRQFCEQNYISQPTIREISMLRREYIGPLITIGFIPFDSTPTTQSLNVNSSNENLLKAIVLGGLWPRVARVQLPKSAIKFDKVQGGTVQRENTAKEYKIFDLRDGRVFLHPSSVLFGHAAWKSSFLVYFQKAMTTKMFLRDATEVPLWSILLFGGPLTINHIAGGLTVSSHEHVIKLKAWPRIGVLVNHIRRLLDAQLQQCIEGGTMLHEQDNPVIKAMLALLTHDGMAE